MAQVRHNEPSRMTSVYGAHGFSDSTRSYTGGMAARLAANQPATRPATVRPSSHAVPISASDPSSAGNLAETRETPKSV